MEGRERAPLFADSRLNMKPVVILERLPAECCNRSTWHKLLRQEHLACCSQPSGYIPVPMSLRFYKRKRQEDSLVSGKRGVTICGRDLYKSESSRAREAQKLRREKNIKEDGKTVTGESRSLAGTNPEKDLSTRECVGTSYSSLDSSQTCEWGAQQCGSGSDTEIDDSAAYDTSASHDSDETIMLPVLSEQLGETETDTDIEERDLDTSSVLRQFQDSLQNTVGSYSKFQDVLEDSGKRITHSEAEHCANDSDTTGLVNENSFQVTVEHGLSAEDEIDAFTTDMIQSVLDVRMSSLPNFVKQYFGQFETCLAILTSMQKYDQQVYVETLCKKRDSLKRIFELFRGLLHHVSFCHVDRLHELERELSSFLGTITGVTEHHTAAPNAGSGSYSPTARPTRNSSSLGIAQRDDVQVCGWQHTHTSASARATGTVPDNLEAGRQEGTNTVASPSAQVKSTTEALLSVNASEVPAVHHQKEPSRSSSAANGIEQDSLASKARSQVTATNCQLQLQGQHVQPTLHRTSCTSALKVVNFQSNALCAASENGHNVTGRQQPLPVTNRSSCCQTAVPFVPGSATSPSREEILQHQLQDLIQRQSRSSTGACFKGPNTFTDIRPLSQVSATAQSLGVSVCNTNPQSRPVVTSLPSGYCSTPGSVVPANSHTTRPVVSKVQLAPPNNPLASTNSGPIRLVVKGANSLSQATEAAHRIIFGNMSSSPCVTSLVSQASCAQKPLQLQGQTTASSVVTVTSAVGCLGAPRSMQSQTEAVRGTFPPIASLPNIPLTVQREQAPFPVHTFGVQPRVPVVLNPAQSGTMPQVRWTPQGLLLVPSSGQVRPPNCSTGFLAAPGSSFPAATGQHYVGNGWHRSNVALVLPPPCTVNQQVRSSVVSIQAPVTVLPAANALVQQAHAANEKCSFAPAGSISPLQNRTAVANQPTQSLFVQQGIGALVQPSAVPSQPPGCIAGVVIPAVGTVSGVNAALNNNVLQNSSNRTVHMPLSNTAGTKYESVHLHTSLQPHVTTGHSR